MSRKEDVLFALGHVRTRLDLACEDAGRARTDVTLLPVTKFFPASDVQILMELGCREFGENRDQEAAAKIATLKRLPVLRDDVPRTRWHMLGQIQSNKAKSVARWADRVHSLSSVRLAEALSRGAGRAIDDGLRHHELEVLIQVSLDGDEKRGGAPSHAVDELADKVDALPHIVLRGLMAVPPLGWDPDVAFAKLAEIHSKFVAAHPHALELSAGMSGDLECAVRYGSTCVRVGTAVLGQRPITSP